MADDAYGVLGLDQSATAEDVRRAYFRLVRQYPPEAHPEEFKRVRAAYETLRSPLRRAELALFTFDESVAEVDLELIARAGAEESLDVAALLLAVEQGAAGRGPTDVAGDLTTILEEDLFA
ncbi:MAG TPA: J domain-containing protein [Chloroflexota bacterium]|nr:J domain-containing protein [Chloroflexota bacterium]